MVCVPWFDQEGVRRPDSLHAQSHAMAEARRLGACPVAPLIEAHRGDQGGWHRYEGGMDANDPSRQRGLSPGAVQG